MRCSRQALVLLAGSLLLWMPCPICAQMPMPITDRPALSPWLTLYSRNQGPLGPYLSIVRPEQRLLHRLTEQRMALDQQGSALNQLHQDVSHVATQSSIYPTGVRASFMNASRYFNNNQSSRAAVQGSRPSWTPPPSRTSYSSY